MSWDKIGQLLQKLGQSQLGGVKKELQVAVMFLFLETVLEAHPGPRLRNEL